LLKHDKITATAVLAAFVFFLTASLAFGATFEETFRAGLVALQSNDLSAAESNLQSAAKLQPANGRVWIALAQTYRKLNAVGKADEAAAKAAKLGAGDNVVGQSLTLYYFEAVQPLLKQEKFAEAIGILEVAKSHVPRSAQIELMLGVACYGLRRFDQAAGAFLETIAIAPELEQPYLFLGKFSDQVPARLPSILKQAVSFEKNHPENAAGWLLHARALNGEPAEAAVLLEKALSIDDRDASAHFDLGAVYDRLQRFPDAAREFEKAVALNPSDAASHYRLARDYDRLGKPEEAKAERAKHAKLTSSGDAVR
jgi:tetratricopeptide (TPR) repeat protein